MSKGLCQQFNDFFDFAFNPKCSDCGKIGTHRVLVGESFVWYCKSCWENAEDRSVDSEIEQDLLDEDEETFDEKMLRFGR